MKLILTGLFLALSGIYCMNICELNPTIFHPDILSIVLMVLGALCVVGGLFMND